LATHHSRSDQRFRSGEYSSYNFPKQFNALTSSNPDDLYTLAHDVSFLYADQVQKDFNSFSASAYVRAAKDEFKSIMFRLDGEQIDDETDTTTSPAAPTTITSLFAILVAVVCALMN
jgi:hypothetical protein